MSIGGGGMEEGWGRTLSCSGQEGHMRKNVVPPKPSTLSPRSLSVDRL